MDKKQFRERTKMIESEMLRMPDGAVFDWNVGMSYTIVRLGNKRIRVYLTPDLIKAFVKAGYHCQVFMDAAIHQIGRNEAIYEK